jgi:hypothetical protein
MACFCLDSDYLLKISSLFLARSSKLYDIDFQHDTHSTLVSRPSLILSADFPEGILVILHKLMCCLAGEPGQEGLQVVALLCGIKEVH